MQNCSTTHNGSVGTGPQRRAYTFALAFAAAVGGFLFGYDLSLIGAANVFSRSSFILARSSLDSRQPAPLSAACAGRFWVPGSAMPSGASEP